MKIYLKFIKTAIMAQQQKVELDNLNIFQVEINKSNNNGTIKKAFPTNSLSWFIQKYKTDKKFIETNYLSEDNKKDIEKFMNQPENKDLSDHVKINKECQYIINTIIRDNNELKLKIKEQFESERKEKENKEDE